MEIAEHIGAVKQQGTLLVAAAERAGLDAPVPTCPAWLVKDLLRHIGFIHRWAASHITQSRDEILDGPSESEILKGGAADEELIGWFRAGHAALVEALSTADPGLRTATFMPAPSPLAFWARRQAHETAIHRTDAEAAGGNVPEFAAEFAADGVDELILGFARRRKYDPAREQAGLLRALATDSGQDWYARAEGGRFSSSRGEDLDRPADATCTVSGPAPGLYLFLWHRLPADRAGVTVSGEPGLLTLWNDSVRVRWS